MAHGVQLLATSFYANGSTAIDQVWWNALDTAQAKLVNGDGGGTWNPSSSIVIQGAGIWICGPSLASANGNIRTQSGVRLTHGDSDYLVLAGGHSGASRSLLTQCANARDISSGSAIVVTDIADDGARCYQGFGNSTYVPGSRLLVPLRVHHGATFNSATFQFIVATNHGGTLPANLPQFRVYKVDSTGQITPLKTTSLPGGWLVPSPANGTAWYNAGATQPFLYTLDASIVVDTTQYAYFAEIIDETGTGAQAGNVYQTVTCLMTGIPDMRAP